MDHKLKSKWESNNFIFDKDYGYDGISWRQRSFMCNFCKKEYKSAQALGGHMNVHRRDRAKLRQSSPSLDLPNPNPKPNFSSPPSSSLRCAPLIKTFHSSVFSLDHISSPSFNLNNEGKQKVIPFIPNSTWNYLGDVRKNMNNEESVANANRGFNGSFLDQENETRVWKKRESFRVEMESGLVKDGKIEIGLDLELRLGRS